MNDPKTVLILDDEPLARKRLSGLLAKQTDVAVVAECGSGDEALKAIFEHQPDILFLDIEMPGKTGFDVLNQIPPKERPALIFVTAYSKYAVRAFEFEALDYLLKPFRNTRFQTALERARRHLAERTVAPAEPESLISVMITIDLYGSTLQVAARDILWIQSDGNYIKIATTKTSYYKRATLSEIAQKLEADGFLRIHRSILINTAHLSAAMYRGNNEYDLTTRDGACFRSGRTYKQAIQNHLKSEGRQ